MWGVNARNREQNFALNLLMDPDIDMVTILGAAGTGKNIAHTRRRPGSGYGKETLSRQSS